MRQDFKKINK